MAYGLLNPLNDSTEWSFRNAQNPNPAVYTKKTYAQVLQDVNTAGYNTVIIKPSYNNYYQSLAYYTIVMFNLSDYPDYYVANAEYLTMQYENGIALESKVGNLNPNQFRVADYRNGVLNIEYPGYNLYDVLTYSTTKDGKTYRGLMADDNNSIALPCVILSNANIGEWYFNNAPVVEYQWSSVPAISGKNGILSLSTADNSYHTGSDVSNIPLSDVSLTDPSKLSSLGANLPVGGTIDAIYAGSIDHINVTRVSLVSIKLDIILAGQSIFSGSFLPSDYLGFLIDEENEVAVMVGYRPHVEADIITGYDERVYSATAEEMDAIYRFLHPHIDGEDPENNEPDEGTDDDYQPDIAITGIEKPTSGAYDTGFTSQYRMSDTQLKSLAQFLWSSSFLDNVKKFFNDPREIIVGLTIMPVLPDTGTSKEVKAGGISTGVYGLPLTDQYKLDTYGSITIKKEKGNFLDYNPYTRVTAHLPFVGEHTLDVNDVMGKTLTLKYIFDFLSGSCVAEIDVNGKPRYFFGGSCGLQIPTSSQDFTRMYSSVLSAGATLGSTLATIATGGLTAPLAIGSAANMLSNGMNGSPTVQFSSGSGSVNGMIGCKTAYLVIEKPIEKISANQKGYIGKPSYMTKALSSCSGFTKCLKVHLDSVPCTSQERDDIESALTNGVRIETGSATPTYTPSSAGMQGLILLKCLSDFDVIGKTWSETTQTVEGKLLYNQSFLSPSFLVSGNYSEYNYAYIPAFGRFYYIKDHIAESGNMTRIEMQVDALQSFKDQILANNAVLERQESLNNAYFADSMYWTQVNKVVKTVPFTDGSGNELKFTIPDDNFILTIAGGE